MQPPRKKLLATALVGIAWIIGVVSGLGILLNYESTPGHVGLVPTVWPPTSRIRRLADRPTLVMLAHPRCPCTRASVAELAQIMARVQGKVYAYVLFLKPKQSLGGWTDTDLRRSAAGIRGVKVLSDVDGAEADRFGSETSGHTFLFGRDGRLLFTGGITQTRGHAGDNAGERTIESILLNDRSPVRTNTPVFGCSLGDRPQLGGIPQCLK